MKYASIIVAMFCIAASSAAQQKTNGIKPDTTLPRQRVIEAIRARIQRQLEDIDQAQKVVLIMRGQLEAITIQRDSLITLPKQFLREQ